MIFIRNHPLNQTKNEIIDRILPVIDDKRKYREAWHISLSACNLSKITGGYSVLYVNKTTET